MSRRNISRRRLPQPDTLYNSCLVNLLISRILKSGKKNLAESIVYKAFEIIQKNNPEAFLCSKQQGKSKLSI